MGNIRLYGSTSGYTELAPPAVAPDGVLALPSGTGTIATQAYVDTAEADAIAAGGLVHINTTTFSAVSSVSINNVFTSDYENYKIIFRTLLASSNQELQMRLRVSGTDSTTGYNAQYIYATATTVGAGNNTASYGQIAYIGSSNWNLSDMTLSGPALSQSSSYICLSTYMNTTANIRQEQWYGLHTTATAYDGATFSLDAGTMSGSLRIYGLKNS
jgi:hypothetical protein